MSRLSRLSRQGADPGATLDTPNATVATNATSQLSASRLSRLSRLPTHRRWCVRHQVDNHAACERSFDVSGGWVLPDFDTDGPRACRRPGAPPRADVALAAEGGTELLGIAALVLLACLVVLLPSAEQLAQALAEAVLWVARIYHAVAEADDHLTKTSVDYRFFWKLVDYGLVATMVTALVKWSGR